MSSSCTSLSTSFLAWGLDCDELAPSCGIFLPGVYAGSSKVSALSVLTKLVLHTPILAYFFPDDNIAYRRSFSSKLSFFDCLINLNCVFSGRSPHEISNLFVLPPLLPSAMPGTTQYTTGPINRQYEDKAAKLHIYLPCFDADPELIALARTSKKTKFARNGPITPPVSPNEYLFDSRILHVAFGPDSYFDSDRRLNYEDVQLQKSNSPQCPGLPIGKEAHFGPSDLFSVDFFNIDFDDNN